MNTEVIENVPKTMRAMVLMGHGGMDLYEYHSDWPVPDMAPDQALINVLERGGRYATSGAIAGPMVSLDLRTLYLHDLSFQGCTITSLNVFPDLLGYIERSEISPVLADTWPLEELVAAQTAFIKKVHVGNIVVTMDAT